MQLYVAAFLITSVEGSLAMENQLVRRLRGASWFRHSILRLTAQA